MKQFLLNFNKQKIVSLLNIFSLSLGITVFLLIGLWLLQEFNFDNFHKNSERIYRSVAHSPIGASAFFHKPFGEIAEDNLPAVEDMCRIVTFNSLMKIDQNWHSETPMILTDPNFFNFFSFSLDGDLPENIFSSRNKVAISKSAVKKYFPDTDPIGKNISYAGAEFVISGIMENKSNSSIQTDFIFPFFGYFEESDWNGNSNYITFFLLHKGVDPNSLTNPLQEVLYGGHDFYRKDGTTITLQPLLDMHFSTDISFDGDFMKGSKSLILTLALTAFIILLISCINFINLFISTSFIRARSVGVKKALGADSSTLIKEVYTETAIYVLLSILIGLFLALLFLPLFNNFVLSDLKINFSSPALYIFIISLFVFTLFTAGTLPAFYLTKFNVTETISGKFKGKKITFFQKSLIIFQITSAIALLIIVFCMQKQINFMVSKDLGFNKENVIYTKIGPLSETFRNEMLKSPHIVDICFKNSLLMDWVEGGAISSFSTNDNPITVEICKISPNYFDFFNMNMLEGENLLPDNPMTNQVIVNEKLIKTMGIDQPIGHSIFRDNYELIIKGVLKNVNTRSFHQEIDPQIYQPINKERGIGVVFFKIQGSPQNAIADIKRDWNKYMDRYFSNSSFDYHFLDQTYEQLYKSEMNTSKILYFATLITFIIAGAGLFAIVYYSIQRRTREIALRKVHGASVESLFLLLNKDIMIWVGIAFLIACIISVYALHLWLNNYVIRTSLSIWIFLLIGLGVLIFAVLTVGYQILKMTIRNPVESLKED